MIKWIIAGAIIGALIPYLAQAGLGAPATATELRDDYSAVSVLVRAAYGALAGWAISALIAHFRRRRD